MTHSVTRASPGLDDLRWERICTMSLGDDIRDFIFWWRAELWLSIPAAIRQRIRPEIALDFVLRVSGDGVRIDLMDGGTPATISHAEPERIAAEIAAVSQRTAPHVEIVLEPGRYLKRHLAQFRLPRRRAHKMAALDVASSTPLDLNDVVPLLPAADSTSTVAECFWVKKQTLMPVVSAIGVAGAHISALKVKSDDGEILIDPADYRHLGERRMRRINRAVQAGFACIVAGALISVVHAQWRIGDANHRLDSVLERLNAEVREVRILSEQRRERVRQIDSVRELKRQAVPVVVLWEELTRVLPDDTWIGDFSTTDEKLTFSGYSAAAAGLLPLIEASSLFRDPTFTSSVVRSTATGAEQFAIEVEIAR